MKRLILILTIATFSCQQRKINTNHPNIVVDGIQSENNTMIVHTNFKIDEVYDQFENIGKTCIAYTKLDKNGNKIKILYSGEFYIIIK